MHVASLPRICPPGVLSRMPGRLGKFPLHISTLFSHFSAVGRSLGRRQAIGLLPGPPFSASIGGIRRECQARGQTSPPAGTRKSLARGRLPKRPLPMIEKGSEKTVYTADKKTGLLPFGRKPASSFPFPPSDTIDLCAPRAFLTSPCEAVSCLQQARIASYLPLPTTRSMLA